VTDSFNVQQEGTSSTLKLDLPVSIGAHSDALGISTVYSSQQLDRKWAAGHQSVAACSGIL